MPIPNYLPYDRLNLQQQSALNSYFSREAQRQTREQFRSSAPSYHRTIAAQTKTINQLSRDINILSSKPKTQANLNAIAAKTATRQNIILQRNEKRLDRQNAMASTQAQRFANLAANRELRALQNYEKRVLKVSPPF